MMTVILIYFIGCLYYFGVKTLNTEQDNNLPSLGNSFESYFSTADDNIDKVTKLLYFSMTTVAKIGYGDFFPLSDAEKIMTVIILLISMIFFSYVLEQFINILQKDPSPRAVIQIVDVT